MIPAMSMNVVSGADRWAAAKNETGQVELKMDLVTKVKNIQKSSPQSKQCWYNFCEMNGNGNYDPARHELSFLQSFVDQMDKTGMSPETEDIPISTKIFVGGLEKTTTEDAVKTFFSTFGQVTQVEMKYDLNGSGLCRGFAFVSFSDQGPVRLILDNKAGVIMNGKQLDVKPARERVFGAKGGGDWSWGMGGGKSWGKGGGGGFPEMMMMMMGMMKGKGKGKGKGFDYGGGWGKGGGNSWLASSESVFAGGVPRTCSQDQLRSYFSQFGPVVNVDMRMDPVTQQFRGFAFITFATKDAAQAVLDNYGDNYFLGKWIDCKSADLGKMQSLQAADVAMPPGLAVPAGGFSRPSPY